MNKRIWNVVYTIVENHNFQEPYVRILASFDSEEKANGFLERDFDTVLNGMENGETVYDIIDSENNGNNATVKLGWKSRSVTDYDMIECVHKWRVIMQTALIERPDET